MSDTALFIAARHRLGEAIIWHVAQKCLYWIDLMEPALFRHDPASGASASWPLTLPAPIGAIAATTDSNRLAVIHRGGASLLDLTSMLLEPWCDPEAGRAEIIYNDAKCDRWGRLWVGSSHDRETDPRGALWLVSGRNRSYLGDAGFAVANGPAVSLDGSTLYFNDSVGRQTLAYDIASGSPHPKNRRVLIRFAADEGVPDGVVTDAEGCLWIAHWGGSRVSRFSPAGKLLAAYQVPALNVTTLCFGGPKLSTLYITTARDGMTETQLAAQPLSGSLFRIETGVTGLPEPLMLLD